MEVEMNKDGGGWERRRRWRGFKAPAMGKQWRRNRGLGSVGDDERIRKIALEAERPEALNLSHAALLVIPTPGVFHVSDTPENPVYVCISPRLPRWNTPYLFPGYVDSWAAVSHSQNLVSRMVHLWSAVIGTVT
jgi:hypothetical protein